MSQAIKAIIWRLSGFSTAGFYYTFYYNCTKVKGNCLENLALLSAYELGMNYKWVQLSKNIHM